MLLTTPDTIRTLQRKLYVKAKQQPAYRFQGLASGHALYDKLYRADILSHAWRLVKANRGSPQGEFALPRSSSEINKLI